MSKFSKLGIMAAGLLAFTGIASADLVNPNATFGFIPFGVTAATYDLANNKINISHTELINTVPCTYLTNPSDFANAGDSCSPVGVTPVDEGSSVTFTSGYTLYTNGTNLPTITWTDEGADTLTFAASSEIFVASPQPGGSTDVTLYFLGTFSGGGYTSISNNASVSFAFTQTGGPTGAVNFSASFATPPSPPPPSGTPEPATMALFGSSLVGIGLLRRRKKA